MSCCTKEQNSVCFARFVGKPLQPFLGQWEGTVPIFPLGSSYMPSAFLDQTSKSCNPEAGSGWRQISNVSQKGAKNHQFSDVGSCRGFFSPYWLPSNDRLDLGFCCYAEKCYFFIPKHFFLNILNSLSYNNRTFTLITLKPAGFWVKPTLLSSPNALQPLSAELFLLWYLSRASSPAAGKSHVYLPLRALFDGDKRCRGVS